MVELYFEMWVMQKWDLFFWIPPARLSVRELPSSLRIPAGERGSVVSADVDAGGPGDIMRWAELQNRIHFTGKLNRATRLKTCT